MQYLRSVVFTGLLFVSVPPYVVLLLLAAPLPHRQRFALVRTWAQLVLWGCRVLCRLDFVVEGREHLPERNTVVLMKHQSSWETIAQFVLIPRQTWVMKRELIWAPVLGWGLMLLKPIAINRKGGRSAVEQVLRKGRERLAEGLWVVIFPEGTRMPAGSTKRYGRSGALLARETGRDIVPVAHNAGDFWPRRGLLKKPGTVRFCIGPPIPTAGRKLDDINASAQAWIEHKMVEISDAYPVPSHAADSIPLTRRRPP